MATTRLGLGGPSAAYAGFSAKDALVVVVAATAVSVSAVRSSAVTVSADTTTAVSVKIGVT